MKLKALLQIIVIFVLPVVLLMTGIVSVDRRLWVLLVFSLIVLFTVIREKWSWQNLGFGDKSFKKSLIPYLIFTCLVLFVIILIVKLSERSILRNWWQYPHFLFMFIPISFLQEFTYRAFLIPKLKILFKSGVWVVLINAMLFAFSHLIFPDLQIALPMAFIGGLGFAFMYYKYPNLILVSLSHMVLNFTTVLYTFFSFFNK